jgi:hypothetical protein
VMSNQSAQHGVGVLGVAQVPGTFQGVQAGYGQAGRVADVVQPRGGFQQISVRAENRRQTACPRGNALVVRPPTGRPSWRSPGRDAWPMKPARLCGPG